MAYRNKTYVCFDGDSDMAYYRLMTAWSANPNSTFQFYNAHDINTAQDSSQEESIKRQLRERFANSNLFIVLIGEKTARLRKFVQWEMEVALKLDLPIIAVNLNGSRQKDSRCPPAIEDALAIFVPFAQKIIEYAMEHWPNRHAELRAENSNTSRFYKDTVYDDLEL